MGGGINIPGVPDVIQEAINACPLGFKKVDAPHVDVAQVARGCIIYRMRKVREGAGKVHYTLLDGGVGSLARLRADGY